MHKLAFALLPYGSGCDLSYVFGWGREPGRYNRSIDSLAMKLMTSIEDHLALFKVEIEGDLYMY